MGVNKTFLSNLEHERRVPLLTTIVAYADAMGIGLELLFTGCPTSDGKRHILSRSQIKGKLKAIGFEGKYWSTWRKLEKSPWRPDEGKAWQLADELAWCALLAENGLVGSSGKVWIHGLLCKKYDSLIGQHTFYDEIGE